MLVILHGTYRSECVLIGVVCVVKFFVIVKQICANNNMENPEEVLQSLDEFAKLKPKDIPRELEDYLSYVAKTGDPVYQWSIVKCLFREKLLNVITDFYETSPTIDLPPCPNVDPFNYETMKNSLLERLESFPSAPFTVQRLCELLTTPRKEYSRADKFMRAIEKNILVVSTREPGSIRRPDSNGQSELLMNGVMDGRGIELGEAIETVSSDGVNIMHANENEVNVTENENVVTVECGGMEEIDMEEQSENMEATTTTIWDKEQSSASSQKEENGNVDKIEEKLEGDDKSKDNPNNPDSAEDNVDIVESSGNSELPVAAEIAESSEAVPENPNSDSEAGSEENRQEVDSTESDSNIQSETSVADEKTPNESEESSENNTTDTEVTGEKSVSEEKISSEKEPVDKPSADEDLSNSISSTVIVVESSNDEIVDKIDQTETSSLVVPNASESVAEVAESEESDSSSSDATPAETCTKDNEAAVVVDSAEVTEVTSAVSTSEVENVEEVTSTKSLTDEEEISETKQEVPERMVMQEVTCQQEEAMEVDEAVSSELPSADVEEPMDQSEQLTTEQQLES